MDETLSLAWDAHRNNICSGLKLLQQNGEFVDMTLAADGHHVKVHQLVLSLASPYIKDLISTAQCRHPIIFLNNISHKTLSAILEYVYTGEAHIPKDSLSELVAAGRALHIKGLKELDSAEGHVAEMNSNNIFVNEEHEPVNKSFVNSDDDGNDQSMDLDVTVESEPTPEQVTKNKTISKKSLPKKKSVSMSTSKNEELCTSSNVQYSISNQGNLQVIFNRYIYNLKYVQKNLNKYWRCVDYAYKKCPANIYTNDKNEVLKRRSSHNHPFHDQKIMKKLRLKVIFGAFNEAEDRVLSKKEEENINLTYRSQSQDSVKESE